MIKELKKIFISSTLLNGFLLSAKASKPMEASKIITANSSTTITAKTTVNDGKSTAPTLTKEQENLYLKIYGYYIAYNAGISIYTLKPEEIEQVVAGIKIAAKGEDSPSTQEDDLDKVEQFLLQKEKEQIENLKKLTEIFLKNKDNEPGIQKTPSGIRYKIIKPGDAVRANEDCTIEVDYEGKLIDGKVFDSTYKQGQTASYYLGALLPGLCEAIGLIGNGGEIQAFIPSDLAYGDETVGSILGGSVLDFTIKLHKITKPTLDKEKTNQSIPIVK